MFLIAVPSENKRDKRTVEQVLADSRAKKKQKTDPGVVSSDSAEAQADPPECSDGATSS